MQTLNFNCSHCGKLMAVGLNLLGRNVRCPHCKQVVQAPATAGPPAAPPTMPAQQLQLPTPPRESHESIFGEVHDDDVFGTRQPKVQMPVEPVAPPIRPIEEDATVEMPVESARSQMPAYAPPTKTDPLPDYAPPGANPWDAPAPASKQIAAEPATSNIPAPMHSFTQRESGGSGSVIFIFMLILYSAAATAGVAYLYFNRTTAGDKPNDPNATHPFSAIPDFFGHYDKANRKEVVRPKGMPEAKLEVPEKLRVALGESLKVHNIEVTPQHIESREVTRFDRTAGINKVSTKSYRMLLLHLRIKNTSEDVILHPTDPAFNARYANDLPYTGIIVGEQQFLGGPWYWPEAKYERQYVEGQADDDKPLGPGEERVYVIASTVQHKEIVDQLYNQKAGIWRVQLRAGLMPTRNDAGTERDVSVCSVIGVPFAYADVRFSK